MQQIELPGLALAEPQALRAILSTSSLRFNVARDPLIDMALAGHAPVYVGVSGGKDSQALAYRVQAHLDEIGHAGVRALIHSDLGRIEWRDSAPVCERLAERLGWELVTVRRQAGDMVDRWLSRWAANVERYRMLSCVKLIMPWSSAAQRFCTTYGEHSIVNRTSARLIVHAGPNRPSSLRLLVGEPPKSYPGDLAASIAISLQNGDFRRLNCHL